MIKVKDLKFDEIQFNPDRRLLRTTHHYNNKIEAIMQIDAFKSVGNELVFQVILSINDGKSFKKQNAFLSIMGIQEPRLNPVHSIYKKSSFEKQGIDEKYMPWVESALQLYKEVNQDLFI